MSLKGIRLDGLSDKIETVAKLEKEVIKEEEKEEAKVKLLKGRRSKKIK